MSLEDSAHFKAFDFSPEQIGRLFDNARRDLTIAAIDTIPEVRFTYAYQALLKIGIALKGRQARMFVQDALSACDQVVVKTYKQEKYGRYLADLFYLPNEPDADVVASTGIFLNQELLDQGLARVYVG